MSNRPRAMPDWLVATTTRQPACVRRAMPSTLPLIGRHSAGDLMYWSLSWLMVPSRSSTTSFTRVVLRCAARAAPWPPSRREPREVGDAVHGGVQLAEQADAVVPHALVLVHD